MSNDAPHTAPVGHSRVVAFFATVTGLALVAVVLTVMIQVGRGTPPAPSDPEAPSRLAKLRGAAETELSTYGWLDKEKGVVRIPIDVAMEKLIERRAQTLQANVEPGKSERP